ncbi:MAG: geranylgeranyl reductase, partial [Chloroflexota bacterium]|nr:geranylgeranyl reductase [Chloroflexota bacterium]
VGEAAGFCDPFTGEGIHRALRGAELAAAAADRALRAGDEPALVGPEYARARQSAFRAKEGLTALVQLFVRAPGLMNYAVDHLNRRPELGARLANALGDLTPAGSVMGGRFVLGLLAPW